MNLNNVFAHGSTVDILLKCYTDMSINGTTYAAGQPYTFIKDAMVNIDSQSVSPQTVVTTPSRNGLQTVQQTNYLYRLTIGGVTLTDKIRALFFNKQNFTTNTEILNIAYETIKLEHTPLTYWLYMDGVLQDSSAYSYVDGWFTISSFDSAKTYLLMYTYADTDFMTFNSASFPYFSAVIYGKGNTNGVTSDFRLNLEKLSLMPDSFAGFTAGTQNQLNMVFGIIDADKTVALKI